MKGGKGEGVECHKSKREKKEREATQSYTIKTRIKRQRNWRGMTRQRRKWKNQLSITQLA